MTTRWFHGLGVAILLLAQPADAQCPDGSAPPCAGARPTPRRADPPLDDDTWIVVPFTNVTRSAEAEWLADASANLLYLDLSRWQDVRVVNDARVADLVRQVPIARRASLSLEDAISIARRAGAGRLVMGTFVASGSRTAIAAKVIDVGRSSVLRSPRQDLFGQDSLMPVFSRLAHDILGQSVPAGFDPTTVGTTRIEAYRAYLLGARALNRFDLRASRTHLDRALALDSSFALAHYKMATLLSWDNPGHSPQLVHAAAAQRLSAPLPPRERSLMTAFNQVATGNIAQACETYRDLVRRDSLDVEAWYGLGECNYHDRAVISSPGDTSAYHFRGSWNTAVRAFERVIAIDPGYHLAFQHILDMYTAEIRGGQKLRCLETRLQAQDCNMSARILDDRDTMRVVPIPMNVEIERFVAQTNEYNATNRRVRNVMVALQKAQAWVNDAPEESAARFALANIKLLLGDAAGAAADLAYVREHWSDVAPALLYPVQIQTNLKLHKPQLVRQYVDSLVRWASLDLPASVTAAARRDAARYSLLIGHARGMDSMANIQSNLVPPPRSYTDAFNRAFLLGGDAQGGPVFSRWLDSVSRGQSNAPCPPADARMEAMRRFDPFWYAPRLLSSWGTNRLECYTHTNHVMTTFKALAQHDTARLRTAIAAFERDLRTRPRATPDSGTAVLVTELYLAVHDSTSALRVSRWMLDTSFVRSPLTPIVYGSIARFTGASTLLLWPRSALLRAELEAAIGNKVVARFWYKQFIDLWADADPEFQSIVRRARAAYTTLGSQ